MAFIGIGATVWFSPQSIHVFTSVSGWRENAGFYRVFARRSVRKQNFMNFDRHFYSEADGRFRYVSCWQSNKRIYYKSLSVVKRNLSCLLHRIILTLIKRLKINKCNWKYCSVINFRRNVLSHWRSVRFLCLAYLPLDFQNVFNMLAKYVRCLLAYAFINSCIHTWNETRASKDND